MTTYPNEVLHVCSSEVHYELIERGQDDIVPDIRLLDVGERDRYDRLKLPQKQLEFLTGRTLLKHTLADRLGIDPQAVSLVLTATGKPYLRDAMHQEIPRFNLSHANGRYLLGLSDYPIGVDIELVRPITFAQVSPFLHPAELYELLQPPEAERARSFFRLFTAKEAFIKATDKRWPLDSIAFSLHNQRWELTSPTVHSFDFFTYEQNCYCSTVCVNRSSVVAP